MYRHDAAFSPPVNGGKTVCPMHRQSSKADYAVYTCLIKQGKRKLYRHTSNQLTWQSSRQEIREQALSLWREWQGTHLSIQELEVCTDIVTTSGEELQLQHHHQYSVLKYAHRNRLGLVQRADHTAPRNYSAYSVRISEKYPKVAAAPYRNARITTRK